MLLCATITAMSLPKRLSKSRLVRKIRKPHVPSSGERLMAFNLRALGIPYLEQQKLIPGRKFALDFLIQRADGQRLGCEVDGGVHLARWKATGHDGRGRITDAEKTCLFLQEGIPVIRITPCKIPLAVIAIEKWYRSGASSPGR